MSDKPELQPQLLPLQIVVLAMCAGMLAFGVVACALGPLRPSQADLTRVLLIALAAVAAVEFLAFLAYRAVATGGLRRKILANNRTATDSDILPGFTTLTLIRSAMCDSVGLFALVTFLLTGPKPALAIAAAALTLLLMGMPTHDALRRFRETLETSVS